MWMHLCPQFVLSSINLHLFGGILGCSLQNGAGFNVKQTTHHGLVGLTVELGQG